MNDGSWAVLLFVIIVLEGLFLLAAFRLGAGTVVAP